MVTGSKNPNFLRFREGRGRSFRGGRTDPEKVRCGKQAGLLAYSGIVMFYVVGFTFFFSPFICNISKKLNLLRGAEGEGSVNLGL